MFERLRRIRERIWCWFWGAQSYYPERRRIGGRYFWVWTDKRGKPVRIRERR